VDGGGGWRWDEVSDGLERERESEREAVRLGLKREMGLYKY